jgi:vacuolar-type H+-ATPase subunit H
LLYPGTIDFNLCFLFQAKFAMNEKTAIQSALDAEQLATRAVDEASRMASAIRKAARDRARQIDSSAQSRIAAIQRSVDAQIEAQRKSTEANGAATLRQLRVEAIDSDVMTSTIDSLVHFLLFEDEIGERGAGD